LFAGILSCHFNEKDRIMDRASADRAADLLISLYRRTADGPVKGFPEDCCPTSFFDVQLILDGLIDRLGRPVEGLKLYFPFKAGQPNLIAPIFNLLASGDHITTDMSRLRIWEPEIVFRATTDLPPRERPYTYEEVAQATQAVPAIEFLATRFDVDDLDELAGRTFERYGDNTLSGGFVVGEPCPDWRSIDFSKMRIVSKEGEETVGDIRGGHPVVDPFILVFVGANTARERQGIRKGQILATLSPSALLTAAPNASISAHFEGLGDVATVFDY
jgi:2-keto-4-pentenoate hydratase